MRGLFIFLKHQGKQPVGQEESPKGNAVVTEDLEVMGFDVVGQKADSMVADPESRAHGHQEDSQLAKGEAVALQEKLEDFKAAVTKHDRNAQEKGELGRHRAAGSQEHASNNGRSRPASPWNQAQNLKTTNQKGRLIGHFRQTGHLRLDCFLGLAIFQPDKGHTVED